MTQQIIKNLTADTLYTLPQQYTAVVGSTGIVDATSGDSFIAITSGGGYIDYLMTILFRSNTGVQFPKVHILLVQPLDATKFELVSIVSFYKLSDTKLVLNVGRELTHSYAAADLLTVQIDAQYSDINIQTASYEGNIAALGQAPIYLNKAAPPSFNNNFAGGPPIAIYGAAVTVAVTGGGGDRTSVDPTPPALRLTWNAIGNALYTTVGDYNTFFGSDFTTLTVDGNDQLLTGNSTTFAIPGEAFYENGNIIAIDDSIESITSSPYAYCIFNCTNLTSVSLPVCTFVAGMSQCTSLTNVNIPLCSNLGGTTGDDFVFDGISGQTITLTIAASRETCDGGNPDGDIVYLAANNTSIIIYV